MKSRYTILTNKEKERILTSFYDDKNMKKEFTLTHEEIERINKINKSYVALGYAVQLIFLRSKGISIVSSYERIPQSIIEYIASQIRCSPYFIEKYWKVKNTKFRHFQELLNILEFKKFELTLQLEKLIYNIALSQGERVEIVKILIDELKKQKIIIPSFSKIEEVVSKGIAATEDFIFSMIYNQMEDRKKLDNLFSLENEVSNYSRIKNITVNNSPRGVKELLGVIKIIDFYGKSIDLSFLTESKIRYFYGELQRSDRFRIERFKDIEKRYAYLAMFLSFRRREFVDMVIEVTSNYAHVVLKRSKKKTQHYNLKTQQKYKVNSDKLKDVVKKHLKN